MRKQYIGVKQITAKPAANPAGDGTEPGYDVYYVQPDGGEYRSWSPKEVFEKAYRETTGLTFGLAIEALKLGYRVARSGWNGKGIFIELQVPDEHSKMSHPYIYIDTTGLVSDNVNVKRNLVPWLASQTDMLSDDWVIIQ